MLQRFMLDSKKVNRMATLAILPLMVVVIMAGTRGSSAKREPPEAPTEGTLMVANLRDESLTIHPLASLAAPITLLLGGAPHELALANGRLYASLPREESVIEIDPRAPGILRTLTIAGQPHGLTTAPDGRTLFATTDTGNELVRLALSGFERTASWPTGSTPHGVAISGDLAFVVDARDRALRRIDLATGESQTTPAGIMPESVTIAGDHVVVADAASGRVYWFTKELKLAGGVELGGVPVRVVTINAQTVAVAQNEAGQVAIIDLATGEVVRELKVAGRPDGLCLSPSGRFLGIVSNDHDSVHIFRTSDWKVMLTLATGDGPGACAWQ
ncbi:MAG: YncE family protein [Dehalococcoidia bacterium]